MNMKLDNICIFDKDDAVPDLVYKSVQCFTFSFALKIRAFGDYTFGAVRIGDIFC